MISSVTYTVFIARHRHGFIATCPALTYCVVWGKSRAGAYKSVKDLIRRRLKKLIEDNQGVPADPVVSVKHLRINLLELEREGNLR
jgi:predicted RNase H-like HicB family nuclease